MKITDRLAILVAALLLCIYGCSSTSRSPDKPNIILILPPSLPDKAGEMLEMLEAWRREVKADMPEPKGDFDPDRRRKWGHHPGMQATLKGEIIP